MKDGHAGRPDLIGRVTRGQQQRPRRLQPIGWTPDTQRAAVQNVQVDHTDVDAEDLPVQEHERAKRLTLRGRTEPAFHGEPRQKRRDLAGSHRGGMLLVVEEDVPPDPVHVSLFGPPAVMPYPDRVPYLIEELRPRCGFRKRNDLS
jgi:hypothetical protein